MKNDISNKVLEKIHDEHLKPKPALNFLLRRSVFWALTILSLLVGGLAFGSTYFSVMNQEWDLWPRLSGSLFAFVLLVAPYFWLILFAGFIALAYFNLRHTKFGYRWRFGLVIAAYLLATVAIGIGVYYSGLSEKLEKALSQSTSIYHHLNYGQGMWTRADKGLLAGQVVSVSGSAFVLKDLNQNEWTVEFGSSSNKNIVTVGAYLKLIGSQVSTSIFSADEIRQWCGCGGCAKQPTPCGMSEQTCSVGAGCTMDCHMK